MPTAGPVAGDPAQVVVAGHICLDIIPTFAQCCGGAAGGGAARLAEILRPGALVNVGPPVISTGGAVSNTGQALHRLGVPTRLMGKIGDDLFGRAILNVLEQHDPALARGMLVAPGALTSYTIVVNPPGVDRLFLHCPGANDTFGAEDVPYEQLAGVLLFHFGYPPLMRRMYAGGGAELEGMFRQARQRGVITSLDLARPDPASDAGRADWGSILRRVLPQVDLFLPSMDETLLMLDRGRFEALAGPDGQGDVLVRGGAALLGELAELLLGMGAGIVGLKLGAHGFYVRTSPSPERLAPLRSCLGAVFDGWLGRELFTPCFEVRVVGTTGCGDCTIAGFLTALLRGLPIEEAATAAVAVGACSAEAADAFSGVPAWEAIEARIRSGWKKRPLSLELAGWKADAARRVMLGPSDAAR